MDAMVASRLLAEVANGVPASESQVPDSPEVRAMRTRLESEIESSRAAGMDVEVPSDFDVSESPRFRRSDHMTPDLPSAEAVEAAALRKLVEAATARVETQQAMMDGYCERPCPPFDDMNVLIERRDAALLAYEALTGHGHAADLLARFAPLLTAYTALETRCAEMEGALREARDHMDTHAWDKHGMIDCPNCAVALDGIDALLGKGEPGG